MTWSTDLHTQSCPPSDHDKVCHFSLRGANSRGLVPKLEVNPLIMMRFLFIAKKLPKTRPARPREAASIRSLLLIGTVSYYQKPVPERTNLRWANRPFPFSARTYCTVPNRDCEATLDLLTHPDGHAWCRHRSPAPLPSLSAITHHRIANRNSFFSFTSSCFSSLDSLCGSVGGNFYPSVLCFIWFFPPDDG